MKLKIFWFRKDLRLEDNNALNEFVNSVTDEDKFLFLYIKNKNTFEFFGEKRIKFLFESLNELKKDLKKSGFDLFVTEGKSHDVFEKISGEFGKIEIYANEQIEPYCIRRDKAVNRLSNVDLKLFSDSTIFQPGFVLKDDGKPYTVFTPFSKKFFALLNSGNYKKIKVDLDNLKPENNYSPVYLNQLNPEEENKKITTKGIFNGGRTAGIILLKIFYENGIKEYKSGRDFPAINGTSNLSPYIHFGLVSIRECFRTAYAALNDSNESGKNEIVTWIKELIWREFYYNITYHFDYLEKQSFKKEFDRLNWRYDNESFKKWCEGKTGYPIVDAGMRQLVNEGWMHNRIRMVVAMFLTKDLFIDWRWGEKFFANHLIDLDFSSNNGGWQWSASTGCDAQPYFRIFNPILQSKKFDTDGVYIKKYVKELSDVPSKYIHSPWEMSKEEQEEYGVVIGKDYPEPIVNHSEVKELILTEFKKI